MRLLTAILVSTIMVAPSFAQGVGDPSPHFRFGFNGDIAISVGEPPEEEEPGGETEVGELSYSVARPAYGASMDVPPIWQQGLAGYGYEWYSGGNEYAELNEQTGVVTWTAGFQGRQEALVYAYTDAERSNGAIGTSVAEVPRDYEITFAPGDVTTQWGRVGPSSTFTFTASTVPAQPESGAAWQWIVAPESMWIDPQYSGSVMTFDGEALVEAEELTDGDYVFVAVRTAGGKKVYSDKLKVTVTPGPHYGYATSAGPAAVVRDEGIYASIQIKTGEPVDLQGVPRLGAASVPQEPAIPTFIPKQGRNQLPPGLQMSATGRITGTPTGEAGVAYQVAVPAVNSAGNNYGYSYIGFTVVEDLLTWDEVAEDTYPDRNNPSYDGWGPVIRGGEEPPEENRTVYRVVAVAGESGGWEEDGLYASDYGFAQYGYEIILETHDRWGEGLAALQAFEGGVRASRIIESDNPDLPMDEWTTVDYGTTHLPYLVGHGRRDSGGAHTACPPDRYVWLSQFATLDHANDWIDYQRSLGSGIVGSLSVFRQETALSAPDGQLISCVTE